MLYAKTIGLVAHDAKKFDLINWTKKNKSILTKCTLYATGSTGSLLEKELGIAIHKVESGPLGGDLELGAKIVENKIDILIFFWDPLTSQPHDPDVKALLRIAVVWNVVVACNEITADIIISSKFMQDQTMRKLPDYREYRNRRIN